MDKLPHFSKLAMMTAATEAYWKHTSGVEWTQYDRGMITAMFGHTFNEHFGDNIGYRIPECGQGGSEFVYDITGRALVLILLEHKVPMLTYGRNATDIVRDFPT